MVARQVTLEELDILLFAVSSPIIFANSMATCYTKNERHPKDASVAKKSPTRARRSVRSETVCTEAGIDLRKSAP